MLDCGISVPVFSNDMVLLDKLLDIGKKLCLDMGPPSKHFIRPSYIDSLELFATDVQAHIEDLLVVFISFKVISSCNMFKFESMCEYIIDQIGYIPTENEKYTMLSNDILIKYLKRNNKRMFIIIDDIEQLYLIDDIDLKDKVMCIMNSIGEITALGNDKSSRVVLVLSSPSSRLPIYLDARSEIYTEEEKQKRILQIVGSINLSRFSKLH